MYYIIHSPLSFPISFFAFFASTNLSNCTLFVEQGLHTVSTYYHDLFHLLKFTWLPKPAKHSVQQVFDCTGNLCNCSSGQHTRAHITDESVRESDLRGRKNKLRLSVKQWFRQFSRGFICPVWRGASLSLYSYSAGTVRTIHSILKNEKKIIAILTLDVMGLG